MIMYRTNYHDTDIKEVVVIKQTEKTVTYNNGRAKPTTEHKLSDWAAWHETREAAIQYLIDRAQGKVDQAKTMLEYAQNKLDGIKQVLQ